MKILKQILNFIMISINIILYILSEFLFNKVYFILFTITTRALILWSKYRKIKKLDNLSSKISKLLRRLAISFNLIWLVIVSVVSYSETTYKGDLLSDSLEMVLLLEMGKENYYDKMNEKKYENIMIVYNKDIEWTLPLIEKYIEKISKNLINF